MISLEHFVTHLPRSFDENSKVLAFGAIDASDRDSIGGKLEVVPSDVETARAPWADRTFDTVIVNGRTSRVELHDTVTKSYNLLDRGGLMLLESSEASLAEVVGIFEEHGISLEDIFFDHAAWIAGAPTRTLVFAGIKMSESCGFVPDVVPKGVERILWRPDRSVTYVAITDPEKYDAAIDACGDDPKKRVLFVPTTYYGTHAYPLHALPARYAEWCYADRVAVVPLGLETKVSELSDLADRTDIDVVCLRASQRAPSKTTVRVLVEAGYSRADAEASAVLDIGEVWAASPRWMTAYCETFKKIRYALEDAHNDLQVDVWSPSGEDDECLSPETRMRMWGMAKEPRHRTVASELPGFVFWVKNAVVVSLHD